jgi:hypothetical protein
MKIIYLDHNIVRYFIRGFPSAIDGTREQHALRRCLEATPEIRIALTDWNLVEAANECARRHDPLDAARRYADFFDSLGPIFIRERRLLQRQEMKAYAYNQWDMLPESCDVQRIFATTFAQVVADQIPEVPNDYSLRHYLRHLAQNASSRAAIMDSVNVAKSAQQAGIDAYNSGRSADAAIKMEIDGFYS